MKHQFAGMILLICVHAIYSPASSDEKPARQSVFAKENLVAWCIVPFDALERGPAERAAMIKRLGIAKVAYDWREAHVPTFEEEILAYQKYGIEFFAFWSWHEDFELLIRKYRINPQIWKTCRPPRNLKGEPTREALIEATAKDLLPLVQKTKQLGLKLGLYNHGGWGGEPVNLVAVCKHLHKHHGADHVGIVYNFHHAHDHIDDFAESLQAMQPYLLCLNLNGMNDGAHPKILALGEGTHEKQMIQIVRSSGYQGPIGIIDHRAELDAEESLKQNLTGLKRILTELGDHAAAATFDR